MPARRTTDHLPAHQPPAAWWARQPLARQHLVLGLSAALLVALPTWWWSSGPVASAPVWAPWAAALAGGVASTLAAWGLARRHALALQHLAEAARQLSRDDAADDLNLPLLADADELQQARFSLRRMVELQRAQRQALQLRNLALGQQLQQRSHELTTLQDLSVGLASGQDMFELVEEALKALSRTLEYSSASLWARDRRRDSDQVVLVGYRVGGTDDAGQPGASLRGQRLSRSNLQRYEQLEQSRQPLIENHVRQGLLSWLWEKVVDDSATAALYRTTRAWMAVPLAFRDEVLGVMRVDHRTEGYFDPERARLLNAVCSQTALAMHHAQLLLQQRELAVSAERSRIARDLHDAVSQTLFAANVVAGAMVKQASRGEPPPPDSNAARLLAQARTLERLNRGALAEMRLLMFELRPDALAQTALAELLRPVLEALECRGDMTVHAEIANNDQLAPDTRLQLYRIAQEALSNVSRHSRATGVTVRWLPDAEEGPLLEVIDNGQGFDPAAPRPGHFGVDNLHSRAEDIGARLTITSAPMQGTTVQLRLPPPAPAPQSQT